jgi:hypothetical protein
LFTHKTLLTTVGYAVVRLRALAALLSARLISNRPIGSLFGSMQIVLEI